jgi:hypothetical protein
MRVTLDQKTNVVTCPSPVYLSICQSPFVVTVCWFLPSVAPFIERAHGFASSFLYVGGLKRLVLADR